MVSRIPERDFFIAYTGSEDLTPEQRRMIFRPRTSNLLSEYHSMDGPVRVWTTFSPDQIDLNYRNPKVLLRVIEILLLYVRHGADIIRLDAVSYLWREPGTRCINLAQTHEIVKLFRNVLDIVAPSVTLITETNVPHNENISYFGNGDDGMGIGDPQSGGQIGVRIGIDGQHFFSHVTEGTDQKR